MPKDGFIFDIQPFSLHDGPGTRTTVFMQGCPLRCKWCHNPESQPFEGALLFYPARCIGCGACAEVCPEGGSIRTARHTDGCTLCGKCAESCYAEAVKRSGRKITADELFEEAARDRELFAQSGGGVTFSGGEPLMQAEFIAPVMRRLKNAGIHIAVETSLCVKWESVEQVLGLVDLFFADIKCVTPETHIAGVGADNGLILENIRRLSAAGANMILRTPVVPGFNADEEEIARIGRFICGLTGRHSAELLAYHGMCAPKYAALGREFPSEGTREPERAELERYTGILRNMAIDAKYSM